MTGDMIRVLEATLDASGRAAVERANALTLFPHLV
jgi:hypothetical protein